MNAYAKLLKNRLSSIIHEMAEDPRCFVHNPDKDFTRSRKPGFETIMKLLIQMGGNTLNKEIFEFTDYKVDTPTVSALCQQRKKLKIDAFEHLFRRFTYSFGKPKCYKDYRLLAVDGSALNIYHNPDDPETFVRHSCNSKGYNALHLNGLYDLQNKLYLDAFIQPGKGMNEYKAICDMVDRSPLTHKTILIGDRGYESYNVLGHIVEKGWKYLIRSKDMTSNGIANGLKLPDEDVFDTTVTLTLTHKQTKEVKSNIEKYHFISISTPFDYLGQENPFYKMTIRVFRFKVAEDNYRMIFTNLGTEFNSTEINELYTLRWGVETAFRELKYVIGLTSFHSKKVASIHQEIFARLTLYNFCEMVIMQIIVKQKGGKHDYQVNFTVAIDICRKFYSTKKYKQPLDIEALILRNILPIRKDRHYPRFVRRGRTISFTYRVA